MGITSHSLQTLVALAAHLAIAATLFSAVAWLASVATQRWSAPVRHAMCVGALAALAVTPAFVIREHLRPRSQYTTIVTPLVVSSSEAGSLERGDASVAREEPTPASAPSVAGWSWKSLIGGTLVGTWLIGTLIELGRLARGVGALRRLQARAAHADDEHFESLRKLSRQLGMRRPPRLLMSPDLPSPITAGLFRPAVIVPDELPIEASPREWEAALLHELTHVRRRDGLTACLQQWVRLLYWWNPFAGRLSAAVERAAEEISDHAVAVRGRGRELAQMITVCAERAARPRFVLASGMASDTNCSMTERVQQLLNRKATPMNEPTRFTRGSLLVLGCLVSLITIRTDYAQAELLLGAAVNFGPIINNDANDNSPFLSEDGLTLYFHSNRPGGLGGADIWTSTRETLGADWTTPANFAPANSSGSDNNPFISRDGRTFLYATNGPAGRVVSQLVRSDETQPWSGAETLETPINDGASSSGGPFLSSDGLTLLFESDRAGGEGGNDIWEATRTALGEPWSVRNVGANINTSTNESKPVLTEDGLTLFFASFRSDGFGENDIWMSQRASADASWGPATNLGPSINTPGRETPSQFWEPGGLLLFKSGGGGIPGLPGEGGADLYFAAVIPEPSSAMMAVCALTVLSGAFRLIRFQ